MGCTSCGGSRRTGSTAGGGSSFRTRQSKLKWVHKKGDSVARYATKEEAEAAARTFGGEVEERP